MLRADPAAPLGNRATERATSALEQRKKAKATRSAIFKKAEQYVKEYRSEVCGVAAQRYICASFSRDSILVSQPLQHMVARCFDWQTITERAHTAAAAFSFDTVATGWLWRLQN